MIKRALDLSRIISKQKSVFIFGARGTGKTHLVQRSLPKGSLYIDLLESSAFQRFLVDPSLFFKEVEYALSKNKRSLTVAIDEVQKLPGLLDEVHRLIEMHKPKLSFVLSGSSARKLKRGGANLLAGRALSKNLYPFSSLELDLNLDRVLQLGSLPHVYLEEEFEVPSLESYVTTYLKEEIQQESIVRRLERFSRFLELAAQLNGEPIQFSKLKSSVNVSHNTIADYYSVLTDTLIANRIDGWSESVKRQLLQSPKYYLFDCGVLNALNGELRTKLKANTFRYGRLFETWIVQEMVHYNSYLDLGYQFHYWREKQGVEVDIIVSSTRSKPLAAIEIKSSSSPAEKDMRGLLLFRQEYPKVPLWCFCTTPRAYRQGAIDVLPWKEGLARLKDL